MLRLNYKTFLGSIIITGILTWALTSYLSEPKIEIKEKIVTKVQEKVRVLTKIVERPDGTKVTTIDKRLERDTAEVAVRKTTPVSKDWLISTTLSSDALKGGSPTYGIGVSKRLILGLYTGLYVRTDKEFGLTLSYSF